MKHIYLSIGFILFFYCVFAQVEEKNKEKLDPYELMSEYYMNNFHPFEKGNWYTGFAFHLSSQNLENINQLIYQIIEGDENKYGLTFKAGYFMGDYTMVGADFIYNRDKFTGNVVQSGDSILKQKVSSIGTVRPVLTTFFPLTKNHRLSFYNKIGFGISLGNVLERNTSVQDIISKKYNKNFGFSVGISPGVTFFAIENFAFEVELQNLLGYEYMLTNTTTNGTVESRKTSNNVAFNIDLLSLKLGLAYYIKNKKNR